MRTKSHIAFDVIWNVICFTVVSFVLVMIFFPDKPFLYYIGYAAMSNICKVVVGEINRFIFKRIRQ